MMHDESAELALGFIEKHKGEVARWLLREHPELVMEFIAEHRKELVLELCEDAAESIKDVLDAKYQELAEQKLNEIKSRCNSAVLDLLDRVEELERKSAGWVKFKVIYIENRAENIKTKSNSRKKHRRRL
jgi:hypothetical protein